MNRSHTATTSSSYGYSSASDEHNTNSGGSEHHPRAQSTGPSNGGRIGIIDESKAHDYVIWSKKDDVFERSLRFFVKHNPIRELKAN